MLMMLSASVIVLWCGIVCLSDSELAWRIYEWDCRMMSVTPPRLRNWRVRVKQVGSALVALGVLGLFVSFGI